MQIILKNKKPGSLITIIDRKTRRTYDLLFNETCTLYVESEEEVKDYRNCYEAFGVDISIKEQVPGVFVNELVQETPAEDIKPKRARRRRTKVEVPVEEVSVEDVVPVEIPEIQVEEPKED